MLHGRVLYADRCPTRRRYASTSCGRCHPPQLRYLDVCQLDTRIGQAFAEVGGTPSPRPGRWTSSAPTARPSSHWVEGAHALGTLQFG